MQKVGCKMTYDCIIKDKSNPTIPYFIENQHWDWLKTVEMIFHEGDKIVRHLVYRKNSKNELFIFDKINGKKYFDPLYIYKVNILDGRITKIKKEKK